MKKLFTLICLLVLAAGTALAQKMIVQTTDGKVVKFNVTNVKQVTFEEAESDKWVDLALPSGTLWAKYNIGAISPEEAGDYFAWGETKTKDDYTWGTYTLCEGSSSTLTKYNATDGKTELLFTDDAAMVSLGIEWQMPTLEQFEELINSDYTTSEWTQLDGVNGTRITSKSNGKSIFLPAAGYRSDTRLISEGEIGQYWSRTSYGISSPSYAYCLYIRSSGPMLSTQSRESGKSIRPVCVPQPVSVEQIVLGQTSLGLTVGSTQTLSATVLPEDATNKAVTWESSNTSVATVSSEGMVTAVAEGNCQVSCLATDGSGIKAECQVTVIADNSGTINGRDYIDLGLPSGTLWATCNVGANSPEQYGDFFAWGETEPKETYNWSTYKYCKGTAKTLTKYCNDSSYGYNGFTDTLTELLPEDDAATVNWGSEWQMPSIDQIQELINDEYTTKEWTTQNGLKGMRVTSKHNGNSIFLPASGKYIHTGYSGADADGYCLSRSLVPSDVNTPIHMYSLYFCRRNADIYYTFLVGIRYGGEPVRPVRKQ